MAEAQGQTVVPTLHHLTSSQSHRVLFMLEELQEANGTQYKLEIHERTAKGTPPSLKNYFPLGKSPILTVEENGKPSTKIYQLPEHPGTLTESRLILQFLSDEFSKGIWEPEMAEDRAQNVFMQEFANSTMAAKCTYAMIFELIPTRLPFGLKQLVGAMVSPVVQYWKKDLEPVFDLMENALSEERPWFAGKKMGLADFNAIWGMGVAEQRGYFDEKKHPKCHAWYLRVTQRPAYRRACEKGGVYNLVTFLPDKS